MLLRTLKSHYDLIPMVTAVAAGCIGATAFTGYIMFGKSDVRWINKSTDLPAVEKPGLFSKPKLINLNQEFKKPNAEIEKLRAELNAYQG